MGNKKNHGEGWLDSWLSQPIALRAVKMARWDLEDLKMMLAKGFKTDAQRDLFLEKRERWYNSLRNRMKNFGISKDQLAQYGLDFRECKRFYFLAV